MSSTAILVLSCDKYSDIWKPFFDFFKKYWSNCPYPVYLGTNEKVFSFENVKQVLSKKHTTWSEELKTILEQIPEKYVIIILEDYFIYKQVVNREIESAIRVMEITSAAYLKLAAFPKKYDSLWPHRPIEKHKGYGEIVKGSKYRVCLQTAIWEKATLLDLLDPKENPWQFEIEASKRTNELVKPFLCIMADPKQSIVHGPIQYYCTAITSGKWMRGAVKLCKKEGIEIDFTNRKVESLLEEWRRKIYIALPLGLRKVADFIIFRVLRVFK